LEGRELRIRVRYFASIREWTGLKEEELDLPDGVTAETLKDTVQAHHKKLDLQEGGILIAINGGFVEPTRVIKNGDEVALFPPVSGG
jgi:molybdopterin synthase sulfur carrier subunit